ncbi:hypothetical protein DNU06_17010 [Putridiphycobacter roseus]|uniref:DUF4595 domain-containing protein n=1 Tax=Putridiphycobacter roseus TaxID=2219161 RepID=A0A2W1NC06_9FLAO|nr:hypothetical protein [Putridiphycobacter roseus]PZE15646.1 hypothetical protein DNU06_17010 [Putridiphycobacter roseus]
MNSCRDQERLDYNTEEIELPCNDTSTFELSLVSNENDFQKIYLERGIKQRYSVYRNFENGKLVERYTSSVDYFDSLGYVLYSEEFYLDDTLPSYTVKYKYDSLRRMKSEEWLWTDPDSFDKTVYIYEDKLTEIIAYYKDSLNSQYQIDSRTKVTYDNGKIDLLLSENNDTVSYYIHKCNSSFFYTQSNTLGAEYKNGFQIKIYDQSVLSFERDPKGNILTITSRDKNENIEYTINYEYDNELLSRITTLSGAGEVSSISDYKYVD